jgi:hypothetical protein
MAAMEPQREDHDLRGRGGERAAPCIKVVEE